ncbi:PTS sugar transporter subunit IIA [Mycoplasmopsis alligatoris]|uniref:Phosphoenolpyruvate-dependent sugar phosphotransferase system, EIIA 2 n=1 Tax=Mycoplasmopsis alligatoris A21JP2 TaxID=747682 RepID=D4XWZ9_9BACT|nr:PTS sugar transporter subunit IIA [Mycoplasmopsis alligatoris]EFF41342.1 phosphoenolpyruvate-dependent sugar phosphotransferase system, EIIA 2 [Mycoplasmopsis alligatoris A21JP2]
MNLKDLLNEEAIFLDFEANSHDDAIRQISKNLKLKGFVNDEEKFFNALQYRELMMHTSLNDGIAVPHGCSSSVEKPVLAVSISKHGINWEAEDKKPAKLFFTLALKKEERDLQVEAIQAIALYSLDDQFHEKIQKATTPSKVYKILLEHFPEMND